MNMKAAVFSCGGLGDGLISAALANNLFLNDYEVDLFHNTLGEIQSFFKSFTIKKYPDIDEINFVLDFYGRIFISYDESDNFIISLIKKGKSRADDKTFVLNPCPSKNIGRQPYYSDAFFKPDICMVDNIDLFCREVLKLEKTSKQITYFIPFEAVHKKYKNRVAIHPSSAKKSKNLEKFKYMKLAALLKDKGYEPVFVVSEEEKQSFFDIEEKGFILKAFNNLKDLSLFVYESSCMIGNDSGIGHLSSMFDIPTISIFRNYRSARLWRPGWSKNIVVYPSRLIPNLSLCRLRDKFWKKFISAKKILKKFSKLELIKYY